MKKFNSPPLKLTYFALLPSEQTLGRLLVQEYRYFVIKKIYTNPCDDGLVEELVSLIFNIDLIQH